MSIKFAFLITLIMLLACCSEDDDNLPNCNVESEVSFQGNFEAWNCRIFKRTGRDLFSFNFERKNTSGEIIVNLVFQNLTYRTNNALILDGPYLGHEPTAHVTTYFSYDEIANVYMPDSVSRKKLHSLKVDTIDGSYQYELNASEMIYVLDSMNFGKRPDSRFPDTIVVNGISLMSMIGIDDEC